MEEENPCSDLDEEEDDPLLSSSSDDEHGMLEEEEIVCYTVMRSLKAGELVNIKDGGGDVNFLDTGTTSFLSGNKEDFESEVLGKVKIIGIGQPKYGWRMKMSHLSKWEKKFNFTTGVFLNGEMPEGVDRLVPVPPEWKLDNFQTGKSGHLERVSDKIRHELIHSVPPRIVMQKEEEKQPFTEIKSFFAKPSRMRLHERLCHMTTLRKGGKCRCLGCLLGKSVRKRFKRQRSLKYAQKKSLTQLDADFVGPIKPESLRKYRYGLLIIDPKSNKVWAIPIRHKSDNTERFRKVLVQIRASYGTKIGDRVLYYIRTDNENVWDGSFANFLNNNQILPLRPAPYAPQANGKVERLVRALVEGLRAMLLHIDPRLWCWAMEHWCKVWNDVHVNKSGKTPNQECEQDLLSPTDPRRRHSSLDDGTLGEKSEDQRLEKLPYRKFGSLVISYVEDPVRKRANIAQGLPTGKFSPKWKPGVYLGSDPQSSNALVGLWLRGKFVERREKHVIWGRCFSLWSPGVCSVCSSGVSVGIWVVLGGYRASFWEIWFLLDLD